MRTSGGGKEGWMTAIPIAVLVVVLTIIVGGPSALLSLLEGYLRALVEWVGKLI